MKTWNEQTANNQSRSERHRTGRFNCILIGRDVARQKSNPGDGWQAWRQVNMKIAANLDSWVGIFLPELLHSSRIDRVGALPFPFPLLFEWDSRIVISFTPPKPPSKKKKKRLYRAVWLFRGPSNPKNLRRGAVFQSPLGSSLRLQAFEGGRIFSAGSGKWRNRIPLSLRIALTARATAVPTCRGHIVNPNT